MLRNANELQGFGIVATDGAIGSVDEFYFDDERWTVRYLVVDTGKWLPGRRVLISPYSVVDVDWTRRTLGLSVTREQVRNSPDIDTQKPVSRRHEAAYLGYYGYPYYWGSGALWGAAPYPAAASTAHAAAMEEYVEAQQQMANDGDDHLRRTKEVIGYHLNASDGELGHVADFLIDDRDWGIRYLVVNTSNWWFGHKVLVPPDWIQEVSWADRKVAVVVTRDEVKGAPRFDPAAHIDRQFEADYAAYYERVARKRSGRGEREADAESVPKLVSLNKTPEDFQVTQGQADPRGWEVVASGTGRVVGTVDDLIADTETMKVRYLDVDLNDTSSRDTDRHILLPVAYARLAHQEHRVTLEGVTEEDLARAPGYQVPPVGPSYDEEFGGYASGGRIAVREPRERATTVEWSIARRNRARRLKRR